MRSVPQEVGRGVDGGGGKVSTSGRGGRSVHQAGGVGQYLRQGG